MVQSVLYPPERQARRVLELSFPEVDEEVRENYAYLVSNRRMTLDEALEKLNVEAKASCTGQSSKESPATTMRAPSTSTAVNARFTNQSTATVTNSRFTGSSESTTSAELSKSRSNCRDGRTEDVFVRVPRQTNPVNSVRDESVGDTYRRGNARGSAAATTTTAAVNYRVKTLDTEAATWRKSTVRRTSSPSTPHGVPVYSAMPTQMKNGSALPASLLTDSCEGDCSAYHQCLHDHLWGATRVSHSDSDLLDLRESNTSLVRADGEGSQVSAPDVLTERPREAVRNRSAAVVTSTDPKYSPASACTGAGSSSNSNTGKTRDSADRIGDVAERSKKGVWTEPAVEEKREPKSFDRLRPELQNYAEINKREPAEYLRKKTEVQEYSNANGEPLFTDTKLITDDEKALYEAQMKDMMHYWYGEETSMFDCTVRSLPAGQVFFFTTSMTGERQVRDHCRLMENLLLLKLIPHHTIDVADNEFFLRRVRRLYTHNTRKRVMPEMPLLFVDDKLIGDFTAVQELEDAGELDAKLLEAGCSVLRPRVVAEVRAKQMGVPGTRLVLPTAPPKRSSPMLSSAAAPRSTKPIEEAQLTSSSQSSSKTPTPRPPPPPTRASAPSSSKGEPRRTLVNELPYERNNKENESARTVSHDAAPTCYFRNGRRLERPFETAASTAAVDAKSHRDEHSNSTAELSARRSVRSSDRNMLGRNGTTVERPETLSTASNVPHLPSLSSRNREVYDADLISPSSRPSNSRRYSTQPRSPAAAAAVVETRVELC